MNVYRFFFGVYLFMLVSASAAVRYVNVASSSPAPPFTSWATAAVNIQDAIDVAIAGDEIVVTNGFYLGGGRAVFGTMTNRVVVDKAISVRSVNGPIYTHIQGSRAPGTVFGASAVRCVYLTNGASLTGFTLTNGATHSSGSVIPELSGGGVWCNSTSAIVSQCVIVGNHAQVQGGGAYGGTFNNCLFTGNSATNAGATFSNVLNNCTIVGNSSLLGMGGAHSSTLNNCIVYFNTGQYPANYEQCTLNFCCTTPIPGNGSGNISADPLFVNLLGPDLRPQTNSPCVNAGNNAAAPGIADLNGDARIFGGVVDIGAYEVQASNVVGLTTIHYVDAASTNPVAPFDTWATAALTIQDAVDVAADGDEVVVTNGVYASGGRAMTGTMTNRVAVDRQVSVRSVNGPLVTIIRGYQVPAITNGSGAIRCVFLTDGASLSGFTLTNGATQAAGDSRSIWGGGVFCNSSNAVISNCIITGNSARDSGGGACRGTLFNCILIGNNAKSVGGGIYALGSTLNNCVLARNRVDDSGGGVYGGVLNNCTLTDNSASSGGGAFNATLNNCIVYFNVAENYAFSTLQFCCAVPQSPGVGNISVDPLLADRYSGNWRLQPDSPCINSGSMTYVQTPTDLDGNPRVLDGVDVGAYEYQGTFVPVPPHIVTQPTNQTVTVGAMAVFNVTTAGTTPLKYQWLSNSFAIPHATNAWLAITNAQLSYSGSQYAVIVTNVAGSTVSSNALLIVNPAPLIAPYIIAQPTNKTVVVGSDVIFAVVAGGTAPLRYQWRSNAIPLQNATNAVLTVTSAPISASGSSYSVIVTNLAGSETSSNALLVVNPPIAPSITTQPTNQTAVVGSNVTFVVVATGTQPLSYRWNFNGSTPPWATNASATLTNVQLTQAGTCFVTISNIAGAVASSNAELVVNLPPAQGIRFVDASSFNPSWPYTNWATAATNIQDAVDAAVAGDLILVMDGVYATGGSSGYRVYVNKPLTVRSVNGPQATIIDGGMQMSCVSLSPSISSLGGFTVTNGFQGVYGGGFPWSPGAMVTNCVVVGNSGAGVYGCAVDNSVISGNSGGGANNSFLNNCLITGNTNSMGGGTYMCPMNNCTVVSNTATYQGGGSWSTNGPINNSIIYYNNAPSGSNWSGFGFRAGPAPQSYCCTTPDPFGYNCITNPPLFVNPDSGDYRLQPSSPCINAGTNVYAPGAFDLDGNPRIVGERVDMGAYEFQNLQPTLRITPASGGVRLSWPLWASNFELQEIGVEAGSSNGWSNLPAIPNTTNNENAVILPIDDASRLYRLFKP